MKVLSKVDEIGMVKLTSQDVVRHPLVQKIVKAYEEYESRMAKNRPAASRHAHGMERKMTINIEYETEKNWI